MSRKIGLFVGINEYVNDKTATLRYAVKDASSMADVFKKSGYETYLLLDEQATAHNLQHTLAQITTNLSPGDMFLFYFSGHGAEFERKHLLICSNFDPNMYAAGTLTLNKVNQLTRKEGIERLFIIDSCRVKWDNDNEKSFTINGKKKEFYQYISDVYTKEIQEAGVIYNSVAEPIILTSCSSGETSVELTVGGHGFFTRHLLNILLSNTTYLTYRGLVLGLANSIGNTGQHPFEAKPLNANPLIFGDKYSSGGDYCNKPGCLLGGLGFLSNVAASDLKKTSACDDPILIRKLKQGEKCEADEKKRIYNVKDSDGVFISSHIAECDVNSRKYNKLDGSNFYVSAMSFPIEINANLQHNDCPGGIQVRTSLLVKLHPGFPSFGEWVTRTVSDKITLSELTRLLQDEAYGLNLYLQKIIDGVNSFGLVSRYGKEAVAWTGQDEALPEWLEIKNVQYLDAKALPSIAEQQRDAFNKKQQSLQQDIAERQQSLDYYIKVTEIDQAREEIAARNKILKEERERNITVAQQETQIEVMKNNLKLKELEARSKIADAQLARDIKMLELDIVEREEKLQSIRVARDNSTALNAAKIRKIDAEIIGMGPKATTIKTLIITGIVSIAAILVVLAIVYSVLRFVVFPSLPIAQECEKIKTRLSTYTALHYDYGKSSAALNELNAQFKSIQKFADHHIWVPGLDSKISKLHRGMEVFEKKFSFNGKNENNCYKTELEEIKNIKIQDFISDNNQYARLINQYIDRSIKLKQHTQIMLQQSAYIEAEKSKNLLLTENKKISIAKEMICVNNKLTEYKEVNEKYTLSDLENDLSSVSAIKMNKKLTRLKKVLASKEENIKSYLTKIDMAIDVQNWNNAIIYCNNVIYRYKANVKNEYINYALKKIRQSQLELSKYRDSVLVINDLIEHTQTKSFALKDEKYRKLLDKIIREKNIPDDLGVVVLALAINHYPLLRYMTDKYNYDLQAFSIPSKINGLTEDEGATSGLHMAAYWGCSDLILTHFLKNGVHVDTLSRPKKRTPLMYAALGGNVESVTFLLRNGANIKKCDSDGNSVMYFALMPRIVNSKNPVAVLLLKAGVNPNCSIKSRIIGTLPLLGYSILSRDITFFDKCIELGANPSLKTGQEESMLSLAAQVGDIVIIDKLLKMGEQIDSKEKRCSPLMMAIDTGNSKLVRHLISKGADPNCAFDDGINRETVLQYALDSKNIEIIEYLLQVGADPNGEIHIFNRKYTPLTYVLAVHGMPDENYQGIKTLELVRNPTKLAIALDRMAKFSNQSQENSVFIHNCCKMLLQYGATPEKRDTYNSPLELACMQRNFTTIDVLLTSKVNVVNYTANGTHCSVLELFCGLGDTEMVSYLIKKGADVNLHSKRTSPLAAAAEMGHKQIVDLLLSKGAKKTNEFLYKKGLSLLKGKGEYVKKVDEGIRNLHIAASGGLEDAQWRLARLGSLVNENRHMTLGYSMSSQSLSLVRDWLDKVSTQKSSWAQYWLAFDYLEGREVIKSPAKALFYFNLAAKNGNIDSIVQLGNGYRTGTLFPRNIDAALKKYQEAANANNGFAMYQLGKAYLNGYGVPKDNDRAFGYFSKAVKHGYLEAYCDMASIMFRKKDYQHALQIVKKACHNKIDKGIFFLGLAYHMGWGCKKNAEYAIYLYEMSKALKVFPNYFIDKMIDDVRRSQQLK